MQNNSEIVPFLVNLNGEVLYNIEKIIEKIYDKTIDKYPANTKYPSLLAAKPKEIQHTLLYHSFLNIIEYSTDRGDGWYSASFEKKCGEDVLKMTIDTLYYDEFYFLINENLIKFDEAEIIVDDEKSGGMIKHQVIYTKKLEKINEKTGIFDA